MFLIRNFAQYHQLIVYLQPITIIQTALGQSDLYILGSFAFGFFLRNGNCLYQFE